MTHGDEQATGRPIDILLVEDSPTDRLMTVAALDQSRVLNSLHTVENGVDALAFLRRQGVFRDAPRPDLVLLDLNLPKMDGREVLAEIKRDRVLRYIPVIVLTTSKSDDDVRRAYGEYANGYICKPIDLKQLAHALECAGHYWFQVVILPASTGPDRLPKPMQSPAAEAHRPDEGLHVLLVEDSDSDAFLLKSSLAGIAGTNFRISQSRKVADAEVLLSGSRFDVVLTDLGLPDSEGLETFDRIHMAARGVPVVVLSGNDDEELALATLQRGAQDYLLKGEHTSRAVARTIRHAVDRRRIQEKLLRFQRMDALGQLAGGVAHDFNNLLTIIHANSSLLATGGLSPDMRDSLDDIIAATTRGAALTRQLLAFTSTQAMELTPINLSDAVLATSRMLRRILGQVKIELQLAAELPIVLADATMIEQILLNLAVNARDAMPQGGKLTFRTRLESVTTQTAGPESYPGDFVCLSVADTGTGIDPALLERVWEPLFSTKVQGMGTGLGLATVRGIVLQHRGWATISSQLGRGTTIEVFLPTARPSLAVKQPARPIAAPVTAAADRVVLVVDDERAIRQSACRILNARGYRAIPAESGEEALRTWDELDGKIDAVVTDMSMPIGMSGRELSRALHARAPALPVVFSSGFSADVANAELNLREGFNFLPKPFTAADLLAIVNRALAKSPD